MDKILKSDPLNRYTLGIVYEPNAVDTHGDWTDTAEIERACWNFARKLQGKTTVTKAVMELLELVVKGLEDNNVACIDLTDTWEEVQKAAAGLGFQHEYWSPEIGDIVENYIAPTDMVINGETVKKGTWLLGVVWAPEYFEKIQKGEVTGFSLGGFARKVWEEVR